MGITKHQQILEAMKSRIESGEFAPGQQMPTDVELVEEFGVSRPTVAKALQQLERQGLIVRRAGSGTFVQRSDETTKRFGLLIPGIGEYGNLWSDMYCHGPYCARKRLFADLGSKYSAAE